MQRTPFAGVTIGRTAETHICNRFHVRFAAALLCLGLAGCSAQPEPGTSWRDPAAPIAASTRFEAERFAGRWYVRQAFPGRSDLTGFSYEVSSPGAGILSETDEYSGGEAFIIPWQARTVSPGRLHLINEADGREKDLWVFWIDEGFRTAAIGSPDGTFGVIVDRKRQGGADRIAAAREIFDWYGYDMTKLREIRQ